LSTYFNLAEGNNCPFEQCKIIRAADGQGKGDYCSSLLNWDTTQGLLDIYLIDPADNLKKTEYRTPTADRLASKTTYPSLECNVDPHTRYNYKLCLWCQVRHYRVMTEVFEIKASCHDVVIWDNLGPNVYDSTVPETYDQ